MDESSEELLLFQNRLRYCQQLMRNKHDETALAATKISRTADLKARQVQNKQHHYHQHTSMCTFFRVYSDVTNVESKEGSSIANTHANTKQKNYMRNT